MSAVPKSPIPLDLDRAAEEPGVEYADGQLTEKPVSIESGEIEALILTLLTGAARQARTATVFSQSVGYRCFKDDPKKFRKPDVSVVKNDRLAGVDRRAALLTLPADLVVEVVSPSDLIFDVDRKVNEYLSNGFPLIWVVHPESRAVAVYRAGGPFGLLHEKDEITGESALPTFRCKVADFFP